MGPIDSDWDNKTNILTGMILHYTIPTETLFRFDNILVSQM